MAKNDYWVDTGAYEPQQPAAQKKDTKILRIILLIAGIFLAGMVAFMGLIQLILHAQKDTEEYKTAYSYLIASDAFAALDADESDIRMNQYSSNTSYNNGVKETTVTIGFMVNFRSFRVVCHQENGVWQVCDECTIFD